MNVFFLKFFFAVVFDKGLIVCDGFMAFCGELQTLLCDFRLCLIQMGVGPSKSDDLLRFPGFCLRQFLDGKGEPTASLKKKTTDYC